MRIEVTYNSEQFIQACFGEGIESAKEYVKANPKDKYGADDFAEVYRMQEVKQKARYGPDNCYSGGWAGWSWPAKFCERIKKNLERISKDDKE